jgi:cyclophilin family peptidyl-prolyl cis-trans isomerase
MLMQTCIKIKKNVVIVAIFLGSIFGGCQPKHETKPSSAINYLNKGTNMGIDLSVDSNGLSKSIVTIKTSKGIVKYRFYPNDAPNTVKRMVELIQNGFYNKLTFHRVEPGFVVQGGDPYGTGMGGSGQKLLAEFNQRQHREGTVAMARSADPNSADSQFYITLGTFPHLDGTYTIFGQVVEGMDVVKKLQVGDIMETVTIQ